MARFLINRLIQSAVLLLGVSIVGFALMHLAPGGPLAVYTLNPTVTAQDIERVKVLFGLDKPVYVQYLKWAGGLVTGNWGYSFFGGQQVREIVLDRLPATFLLMGSSLALALVIGVAAGTLAAVRRNSVFDYATAIGAMIALSLPTFWFGLLAIFFFAQTLGWFPAGGMMSMSGGGFLDLLHHMVLPVAVLALVLVAQWSRYTRSSMIDILDQDFVRTARAKGLKSSRVLVNHGLRAALVPLVALAGLQLPLLVGGALVTETVFSWPGMGLLFISALSTRDYPVLMAILMVGAVVVVLGNLLADIVVAFVDPRVKLHDD
ncbi:ABC transporter permease [Nordella sp. HKS 07]|uniref:ABC transporter permease n=1 Tax=Nordella sp. HKS 07 TaxID=2712222 RepID=UPI0013E1514A|nr:ABC transporter permease [Nordella sp. HKS 07]QIG52033.1 ABC transporter permease [Nordella sp. HKS 07]